MTYIAVDKMRKNKDGNGGTIVNLSSDAGQCERFLISTV